MQAAEADNAELKSEAEVVRISLTSTQQKLKKQQQASQTSEAASVSKISFNVLAFDLPN